jgi:hypothetical protein
MNPKASSSASALYHLYSLLFIWAFWSFLLISLRLIQWYVGQCYTSLDVSVSVNIWRDVPLWFDFSFLLRQAIQSLHARVSRPLAWCSTTVVWETTSNSSWLTEIALWSIDFLSVISSVWASLEGNIMSLFGSPKTFMLYSILETFFCFW